MQALKALVIGMAVLIVLGMGLLVYGIATRVGGERVLTKVPEGFGTVEAELPPGASVRSVSLSEGVLVVELAMPDGGARILLFRLDERRQLGTVVLERPR